MKNPIYGKIDLKDIPQASGLVFYGGTKITELFGNKIYGFPYEPAPFHSSVYLGDEIHCTVGLFTTLEKLKNEFRSTRRIDVILYEKMTDAQRTKVIQYEYLKAGSFSSRFRLYDFKGFLYAGIRLLPWVSKVIKPSKKQDFCSDNYVDAFEKAGVGVSFKDSEITYPWDLLTYAFGDKENISIKTLWIGKDFN